ncbi:hypothetical protein E2562_001085 [Oryza meyeriana var. granulata]|uniref:Uncharacterized protein n=1 Tax=Oryza meyeriana var. granulata TaxID=110450 RepID=A0A6G1ED26_9ORYZ|nr:hypothetical protein E2562_001085 [Oryza meyeriana var. granulata]
MDHSRGLKDVLKSCHAATGNRWANFLAIDFYKVQLPDSSGEVRANGSPLQKQIGGSEARCMIGAVEGGCRSGAHSKTELVKLLLLRLLPAPERWRESRGGATGSLAAVADGEGTEEVGAGDADDVSGVRGEGSSPMTMAPGDADSEGGNAVTTVPGNAGSEVAGPDEKDGIGQKERKPSSSSRKL